MTNDKEVFAAWITDSRVFAGIIRKYTVFLRPNDQSIVETVPLEVFSKKEQRKKHWTMN